jgi:hypothetical protein
LINWLRLGMKVVILPIVGKYLRSVTNRSL